MNAYRIDFSALGWESPAPGVRFKIVREGKTQLRLVEFTPELSHPQWCLIGHAGYVLEGVLEVRFAGRTVRFEAGDGILIPPGEAHKHIPRALTDRVRFVSIEDA